MSRTIRVISVQCNIIFSCLSYKISVLGNMLHIRQFVSHNYILRLVQGPQTQSVKCNSSILAYLNVIKTTFLIFSCRKHLHNSFCIHFDAFWCILMHSEHLQKNGQFQPKKNEFFQITISCTKLKNYSFCKHIAAFCCILMHSDAFWCILSYLNLVKTTSLTNSCTKKLHN